MSLLGVEVQPLVARDSQTGVVLHVVAGRLDRRDSTERCCASPIRLGAVGARAQATTRPERPCWSRRQGPSLQGPIANDIIFLFDNGEELGDYRGGHMFDERHSRMRT
jgi:hypothetical protein